MRIVTNVCQNPKVPILQIICIPFAGSGASFFRNLRPPQLDVSLVPVQLPGREERFADLMPTSVGSAADDIAESLSQAIDPSVPSVIFGHSLGAVLAFETVRRMPESISHLFVSGSPDPWHPRTERAGELSDAEFLDRVEDFAQYRHPALEDPEMRDIILPALRADVTMHESYIARPGDVIGVPITAMRGVDDRLVSEAEMLGWRRATSDSFNLTSLSGSHMYLVDKPLHVLEVVVKEACRRRAQ